MKERALRGQGEQVVQLGRSRMGPGERRDTVPVTPPPWYCDSSAPSHSHTGMVTTSRRVSDQIHSQHRPSGAGRAHPCPQHPWVLSPHVPALLRAEAWLRAGHCREGAAGQEVSARGRCWVVPRVERGGRHILTCGRCPFLSPRAR